MNIVVHIQYYKIWKSERNWVSCWNTFFLFVDTFSGCDWTTNSWSCCSTSHPCGPLEGDCDSNEDCINHLLCGNDNCFDSFSSTADCCYDPLGGKIGNQNVCFLVSTGVLKISSPEMSPKSGWHFQKEPFLLWKAFNNQESANLFKN